MTTSTEPLTEDPPRLKPHADGSAVGPPLTIIEARKGWQVADLGELWRYRELLFFLTWRDVKVRYKQTVLGAAWAVLQPLATMIAFALFLGPVLSKPSAGVPYPLYVFAGLLPWTFFAAAIGSAGQSVVGNQNLVTKVYFPRLMIPMSAVGAALVDFIVAFGLLLGLMAWYGVAPGRGMVLAVPVALGLVLAALGVGTLLSALTVAYRDFRHVIAFLVQFWMFATPIIYLRAEDIGPRARAVLPLNPAYGLIANFRRAMLGEAIDWYSLGTSGGVGVLLLAAGCLYFRRVERSFADII